MKATLTKEQIEHLNTKLIVPMAVNDILTYGLEVEPEMQYGLHEALSEIDPDSALLAIALSAQQISGISKASYPIASGLYNESVQILNDYGPDFIRDLKRGSIPQENFLDILKTVPEDLEAMADLLDALCADIEDELSPIVMLANLLSIQARAHMEIAMYILEEAGKTENKEPFTIQDKFPQENDLEIENIITKAPVNNIILFPTGSRN